MLHVILVVYMILEHRALSKYSFKLVIPAVCYSSPVSTPDGLR